MKLLDYRIALVVGMQLTLAGCPAEEVPTDETGGEASTGSTGTTPATTSGPPESTGPGPDTTGEPPADSSTTAAVESSDGPNPDTGTDTGIPSICGNNVLEDGEVCDLAQLSGETCQSLGYQGGQLGCLLTCDDYNLLGCFICGNEVVDIAEDCEGTVPEGVTCEGLGFEAGEITCGDDCLFDLSDCSICGDGIQAGPEQCDGLDFGGSTCASLGFDGGNLGCNLAQCAYSYQGCFGGMYVQDFEGLGGMMPPEFSVDVVSPWTVSNNMPIDGTFSARSGNFAVGVGGITNLTLQASFPVAGSIAFDHRESCANGIDFLEFYVDGVFQQSWSGITVASTLNVPVAAGNHTFVWRFNRAGFLDKGSNAVWVDDITLSGGVPI